MNYYISPVSFRKAKGTFAKAVGSSGLSVSTWPTLHTGFRNHHAESRVKTHDNVHDRLDLVANEPEYNNAKRYSW